MLTPQWTTLAFAALVVVALLLAAVFLLKRCAICGRITAGPWHRVKIDGAKRRVCSRCSFSVGRIR